MTTDSKPARMAGWKKMLATLIIGVALIAAYKWYPAIRDALTGSTAKPATLKFQDANISNIPTRESMNLQWGTPKAIDGDLTDWNLEGDNSFTTTLDPDKVFADGDTTSKNAFDENNYKVQGAMMEDSTSLYISAIVGDPEQIMIKNNTPRKIMDLDAAQTPGSYLQVRFSCDGDTVKLDTNEESARKKSRTTQLAVWYSHSKGKAYLGQFPGIASTPNGTQTVEAGNRGFECVFRQEDNKCTIEAKIPWEVIGLRPGPDLKEMPCVWQVIRRPSNNTTLRVVDVFKYDTLETAFEADTHINIKNDTNAAQLKKYWGSVSRTPK